MLRYVDLLFLLSSFFLSLPEDANRWREGSLFWRATANAWSSDRFEGEVGQLVHVKTLFFVTHNRWRSVKGKPQQFAEIWHVTFGGSHANRSKPDPWIRINQVLDAFPPLSPGGEELIMKNLKNGKREFRTMRIDFTFSQGYNSRPNLNSFIILSSSINSETRIIYNNIRDN